MRVAVLIPYRGGCPHRERALAWVIAQLADHRWPVILGQHEDGPWCKAQAIDAALAQTDAEVLVIHDADVYTDGLPAAVRSVKDGPRWAIPHRGVFRLTQDATTRLMAGHGLEGLPLTERAYLGVECGGVFVIRREVYEACPMDPRFTGFGGEDESLSFALRCLHGAPWRGRAQLAHLWHPPQERATRSWGSIEGRDLRKRYARARTHETAMTALLKEAMAHGTLRSAQPAGHADPAR